MVFTTHGYVAGYRCNDGSHLLNLRDVETWYLKGRLIVYQRRKSLLINRYVLLLPEIRVILAQRQKQPRMSQKSSYSTKMSIFVLRILLQGFVCSIPYNLYNILDLKH